MEKIDLHIHTNYSDGQLNIYDIFELARKEKIKHLAITDHDTIINLKEAKKVAEFYNIDFIEGIEISVGKPCKMHILGYGILDLDKVEEYVQKMKRENVAICKDVIKLLQEKGYEISIEEVIEDIKRRKIENQISSRIVQSKYSMNESTEIAEEILDKRAIAKVLVKKGYARNNKAVYDDIMGQGCECYIPIKKMDAKAVIDLISLAGGVAILAHPTTIEVDYEELEDIIKELQEMGLKGIEIVNGGTYHEDDTKRLIDIANKNGLIKTMGTDFHRTTDANHILGLEAEESIITQLKEEIEKSNTKWIKLNKQKLEAEKLGQERE